MRPAISLLSLSLSLVALTSAASAQMTESDATSTGQFGQRQSREDVAENLQPTSRIDNRIRDRINTRIRSRISNDVEAQTDGFEALENAARDVQRTPLRPDD